MIKSFFIVAIRNLYKNKFQSLLNILCLSIGMASILIILAYAKFEMSFDKFNKNSDRIFRAERLNTFKDRDPSITAGLNGPLGPILKSEHSEINDYTRILRSGGPLPVNYKDKKIIATTGEVCWVDASFLSIFDCKLLKGNINNALSEPNTIVLTNSVAGICFGKEDPIDKSILIDNTVYRVTGIIADAPINTHFHYKYLISYSTLKNLPGYTWTNGWSAGGVFLYVKLNNGVNKFDVEKRIVTTFLKYTHPNNYKNTFKTELILRPITDIHLHCVGDNQLGKNGDLSLLQFVIIVVVFILLISLVNAINLATSKALERAKEVGVRKVVGGYKSQLIFQFMAEYLLMNIIAMILALIIFIISPVFLNHVFLNYVFSPIEILKDIWVWVAILILLLVTVLMSSLYPAFVLSSYKPISVLRGKLSSSSKGIVVKKCLIVFQYIISIALIAGAITIIKQKNAMQSKNLGFDIDKILIINGVGLQDSTSRSAFSSFKNELLKYKNINSVSGSTDIPGKTPRFGTGISLNKSGENFTAAYVFSCDYSFLDVYNMKIVAGRNFSESFKTDRSDIIISENISKGLNFKSPKEAIDKIVYFVGRSEPLRIIGVIADYNQTSPKFSVTPIAIRLNSRWLDYISINLNADDSKNTISTISNTWKKIFPNEPYNHYFLKDYYNQQHINDIQFGNIINFFTIITILIICFGLWALSVYTISQKKKEIAVRKVFNAGIIDIYLILFKYYFYLIVIAAVISLPIAYYIFNEWLNKFTYKIKIGAWFFIIPIVSVIIITIVFVVYNIIKAARTKPAQSLKME